ncbi:hypothetical protein BJ875DRAFT_445280 [Amylocarpus encephaloides]|uniref:2EXR domain-containing protein n=1 Tax=Amylocarpus encephaloides TaxID=45428 RepID=A0A9P7YA65_9HELO|nr:hypothetical protein BJ875DRAFT_445280 [Amylocarpus encephaloides]
MSYMMAHMMQFQAHDEFWFFPMLPVELRLKIFKNAQEQETGRVVEVRWSKINRRFFVDCPVPALLHVCRDSRAIASRYFENLTITVGVTNVDSLVNMAYRGGYAAPVYGHYNPVPTCCFFKIYFNFGHDTLYLSSYHFESGNFGDSVDGVAGKMIEFLAALNSHPVASQKIRTLALNAQRFKPELYGVNMFNFRNLEHLHLVFDDSCCSTERFGSGDLRSHGKAFLMEPVNIPQGPAAQPLYPQPQIDQYISPYLPNIAAPYLQAPQVWGLQVPYPSMPIQQQPYQPMLQMPANFHLVGVPGQAQQNPYTQFIMPQDFEVRNVLARPIGLPGLTYDEQHAVKIMEIWQKFDDQLTSFMDTNAAEWMASTNGMAREDWQDLVTAPIRMVRQFW